MGRGRKQGLHAPDTRGLATKNVPLLRQGRIRTRLTLWYVVLLAVVLLLFSGALYLTERQALEAQLDAALRTRLDQVAAAYDARTQRLAPSAQPLPATSSNLIVVLTPRGQAARVQAPGLLSAKTLARVAAQAMTSEAKGIGPSSLVIAVQGGPGGPADEWLYRISSRTLRTPSGQISGVLVVGLVSTIAAQLATLTHTLLIVAPLILLLCGLSGYLLATRAMAPVQAMTWAAQQIEEADLSRRLHVRQGDELGDLAATFNDVLDRLEAAFARQRQFTADASHELRTPLAIIDVATMRALEHAQTVEEHRHALSVVRRENARMARLVDGLLTLARADSGRAPLTRERVDLGEITLDVVERLAPRAAETHMLIDLQPLPEAWVRGDRLYVEQLLTNIVDNALIYGADGGSRVHIAVGEESHAGRCWVCVRVRDDGPGIAPEHLPHLFERFYRADQARAHGAPVAPSRSSPASGSGLGLAIARWIAQAHQGDIRVEAGPGRGTVVEVWLPADQAGQEERPPAQR